MLSLRLAALLCHARNDVPERVVALRRTDDGAQLRIDRAWADGHPRTMHLLGEEVRAWERAGRLKLAVRTDG